MYTAQRTFVQGSTGRKQKPQIHALNSCRVIDRRSAEVSYEAVVCAPARCPPISRCCLCDGQYLILSYLI